MVNLIIELFRLKDYQQYSITFLHGYFVLNGQPIGIHLFANIITLLLLVISLMVYQVRAQNRPVHPES